MDCHELASAHCSLPYFMNSLPIIVCLWKNFALKDNIQFNLNLCSSLKMGVVEKIPNMSNVGKLKEYLKTHVSEKHSRSIYPK